MHLSIVAASAYCLIVCEVLTAVTYKDGGLSVKQIETPKGENSPRNTSVSESGDSTNKGEQISKQDITTFDTTTEVTTLPSVQTTEYDSSPNNTHSVNGYFNALPITQTSSPGGDIELHDSSTSFTEPLYTTTSTTADIKSTTIAGQHTISPTVYSESPGTINVTADTKSITSPTVVRSQDTISHTATTKSGGTVSITAVTKPLDTTILTSKAATTTGFGLNDVTTIEGEQNSHHMSHEMSTNNLQKPDKHTENTSVTEPNAFYRTRKRPPKILLDMKSKLGISGIYYILLVLLYIGTVSMFVLLMEEPK